MMEAASDRKEVLEFKFGRLCNLRLFPTSTKLDRKYPLSVVATSNKYGLIFAGTPSGIQCIPITNVIDLQEKRPNNRGNIENYQRREHKLGSAPSHVGINSSGDLVAVVIIHQDCPVLQIYYVQSFASQDVTKMSEMRLSSTPGTRVLDLQWNPAVASMIGAVVSDGSAVVCEFNSSGGGPTISSAPPSAQAMCLCWSPKGKQVVLGSNNGSLTQYKPDLKLVKSYPPPQIPNTQLAVSSVHWLSSFQFIAVYKATSHQDPEGRSLVMVVNVPKSGQQTFVNYEDICFGSDTLRPEHFFIHVAAWNVLIISTGNGLEVSVLHQEGEKWVQWLQDEGGRAELPQTETHDDVFAVGMALNTNATKPIPVGDSGSIPPMPYLLFMSEEGVLCIFHTINVLPNAATVCAPAKELSYQFFKVGESQAGGEPAAPPAVSASPAAKQPTGMGMGAGEAATKSSFFPPTTGSPFQLGGGTPSLQAPQAQAPTGFQMFGAPASHGAQVTAQPKSTQPEAAPPKSVSSPFSWAPAQQTGASTSLFGVPASKPPDAVPSVTTIIATSGFTSGLQSSTPTSQVTQTPSNTASSTPLAPIVTSQPAAPPPKESTPAPEGPPPVDDTMIKMEIAKEVAFVENLLSNFRKNSTAILRLINDKSSLPSVAVSLDGLEKFDKELRETTATENAEVRALKASLVEMWGWLENIKAKNRQSTSQRYLDTLESKELDPLMKKIMKNIEHNTLYVETKIKEATDHLNYIWEKQKEQGSAKNFDIPHMEAIYQTMAINMKMLAVHQATVSELEMKLTNTLKARKKNIPQILNDSHWSTALNGSDQNSQLEKLADKLLQTRIDGNNETSRSFKEAANRYIALTNIRKPLPSEKERALWNWHKSHKVIHTKASRIALPDNEILNRLSLKTTPSKTPVSAKSAAPIVETPVAPTSKPISRNLFVTPAVSQAAASAAQIFPPLVTSTPFPTQAKIDESRGTGKGFLSPITQSISPVSLTKPAVTVEPKGVVSQASAPKSIFVSPFTATSTTKELSPLTPSGVTQAPVANSPPQIPSSKAPSVSTSSPFSLMPGTNAESAKIPTSTKENQPSFGLEPNKTVLTSDIKTAASTSTVFGSLSGSTMTVATDKVAAPVSTTSSGSIFGNSPFRQSGGMASFQLGSSPFGSTSSTTSSVAATTVSPAASKPSMFSQVAPPVSSSLPSVSIFSLGSSSTPVSDTKAVTTTTSTAPSPFSAPTSASQISFSSSFSFTQPKPATSGGVTAPSTGTTAASITFGSISLQPTTTSTTPSLFGGSSVVNPVSTVSTSSTTPTVSSAPTVTTTSVSIFGGSTSSTPAVTSVGSPQLVTPDKAPSSGASGVLSFGSLSITPAASSAPSTTTTSAFGSSVFPAVQSTEVSSGPTSTFSFGNVAFGSASTTPSVFGTAAPPASTTESTLFQTPQKSTSSFSVASTQPVFGTPTTSSNLLATSFSTPTTSSQPTFGTPTTSALPSFGTSTTAAQPSFGTPTTSSLPTFGTPTTSAQPAFGTPTTSTQSTFGAPAASTQPTFGTPTTSAQPSFGPTTATTQPAFGASTTAQPSFGTPSTSAPAFGSSTTSSSVFGTPTSATSVFSAANALTNTSFFGSPTTTATGFGTTPAGNIFGGTSSFSTPSTTSSSIFGAPICSPNSTTTPTAKNVFGSPFESSNTGTAFGGSPSFSSFRSNTPGAGTFGTSGGSIFGGGGSTFGQQQPQQSGGLFQSGNASPSVFGSPTSQQQPAGAFSSGGQNIQQTGFGGFGATQPQQTSRPFGASGGAIFGGQAAFGSPPSFGGTATFGGTNKIFGAPATPAAPAFGSPTQQSSTFENLAGQNTVSFGNLAQNQQPTFGAGGSSAFGQQQPAQPQLQQPQQQQQPAFSNTPAFGGSSFSSWR